MHRFRPASRVAATPVRAAAAVHDSVLPPPPAGARPQWSGRLCKSGAQQCEVVCKNCSTVSAPALGTTPAVEPDAWPAELNMTARAVTQVRTRLVALALLTAKPVPEVGNWHSGVLPSPWWLCGGSVSPAWSSGLDVGQQASFSSKTYLRLVGRR